MAGSASLAEHPTPGPLLAPSTLRPVAEHTFRAETTDGYGIPGELVVFETDPAAACGAPGSARTTRSGSRPGRAADGMFGRRQIFLGGERMSGANGTPEFKDVVGTLDELRALMGEPSEIALRKDIGRLDEHCRAFIARAPFVLVATANLEGRCDVSPKGDAPGFVMVVDDRTLLIPDRPGNKRFDGMRNLLENPGIGLIFLVPGSEETLRVNGRARIVRDPEWLGRLAAQGKTPQLAIAVEVEESFLHCAKCVKRSGLWEPERWPDREGLASPAQMFRDHARISTMTVEELDQRLQDGYRKNLY